ncbi:uncharacterized protein EI90DRAFT_3065397 [Cantharellus anzutake]|uniref:uncharacterized protein n=1 Tax=Cantharellus anzutake TaxID=1750568 RepID=UPI00190397D3|nr:uncharacterized protein EI90DRAFT_3065397 [Cantharellus anzutake]KAF8328447.1 hypothetical protein EI90DRAFT_3065397 [Cantharellus anzutake]
MPAKGKRRDNQLYAYALPIIPQPSTSILSKTLTGVLGPSFARVSVLNPRCIGVFDIGTRSVWVTNAKDTEALWQRGFFGKGNLSRSEPTWLNRRVNQLAGVRVLTAEELTAKRREERKIFKAERAQAILTAAAEAEATFIAEGRLPTPPTENISTTVRSNLATQKLSSPPSEWRPADAAPLAEMEATNSVLTAERNLPDGSELPENMEHFQLTLQEAFFLMWGLDCLLILDPMTERYLTVEETWDTFLSAHTFPIPKSISKHKRCDNPFLVHYVAYHHFRSLGWVVKSGIKFCVDYLLYRRGPVFSHAEFAMILCPTYEDLNDEESSPFNLPNTKPFSWAWLSTLNRVNTQVRKSIMLVYITIPAMSKLSIAALDTPAVLREFTIREVPVKRFAPARMRN